MSVPTLKKRRERGGKTIKISKYPEKTKNSFYLADYHPSCQRSQ
jgi:hypothetical protein